MPEVPDQIWVRAAFGLAPASEAAERALSRIPIGDLVSTRIRRPRSLAHHRKYWALVRIVAQAMGWSEAVAHRVTKAVAGYLVPVRLADGTTITVEQSIAFSEMDQTAFEEFYRRAVDAAIRITGASQEDLSREIALAF